MLMTAMKAGCRPLTWILSTVLRTLLYGDWTQGKVRNVHMVCCGIVYHVVGLSGPWGM